MERLVDVKELEALTGIARSFWYAGAEAGRIPSVKVGAKYRRFRVSEIEAWLASQRQGPRGGAA